METRAFVPCRPRCISVAVHVTFELVCMDNAATWHQSRPTRATQRPGLRSADRSAQTTGSAPILMRGPRACATELGEQSPKIRQIPLENALSRATRS
jgi:hypothetical protein